MKKYFVLYLAPSAETQKVMAASTPESRKKGMDEWMQWANNKGSALSDMGSAFGKTKRITTGKVEDVRNDVAGYSIVQAESHEEAAKLFLDSPHLPWVPGAYIDVMEMLDMQ